jgi:hypothetical protein
LLPILSIGGWRVWQSILFGEEGWHTPLDENREWMIIAYIGSTLVFYGFGKKLLWSEDFLLKVKFSRFFL